MYHCKHGYVRKIYKLTLSNCIMKRRETNGKITNIQVPSRPNKNRDV